MLRRKGSNRKPLRPENELKRRSDKGSRKPNALQRRKRKERKKELDWLKNNQPLTTETIS